MGLLLAGISTACHRPDGESVERPARATPRQIAADSLPSDVATNPASQTQPTSPPRSWADLLPERQEPMEPGAADRGDAASHGPKQPPIDAERAAAAGIRQLNGKHLTLYTDLPADPDVDQLPEIFDLAIAQWCAYFEIDPARVARWRQTGYLIDRKEPFQALGLLPDHLPPFLHAYQQEEELWIYEQPSAYYRRHLLLHEGTHGFMNEFLGSVGPPWYAEGLAELLGTHRWEQGSLQLGYFPRQKEEVPHWGRIKIVQEEVAAGRGKMLTDIMKYGPRAHLRVEPYGWCWAAAAFFDNHPRWRGPFRQLQHAVGSEELEFSRGFYEQLRSQWPEIHREWQLFVLQLDYGYDVARAAINPKPVESLPPEGYSVQVAADRGWQSSGVRLERGVTYEFTATGRYQVAQQPQIWWCEPGGVTLRYYRGRPLGMLLAAVCEDDQAVAGLTPLARPEPIGLGRTVTFDRSGTLYLQINESPAERADNAGELTVQINRPD